MSDKVICTGCSVPLDLHGTCCGWKNAKKTASDQPVNIAVFKKLVNGKSENLPQRSGEYFCMLKNGSKLLKPYNNKPGFGNEELHWLKVVEWWIDC